MSNRNDKQSQTYYLITSKYYDVLFQCACQPQNEEKNSKPEAGNVKHKPITYVIFSVIISIGGP